MTDFKKKLTPEQYRVMREKGTELPFSGKYVHEEKEGMYACAACGNELFSSDTKFDSGTGWPSFTDPANTKNIELKEDKSAGDNRTEVLCKKCGSHLGHVFDDGPKDKGGKRYCINSVCLELKEKKEDEEKEEEDPSSAEATEGRRKKEEKKSSKSKNLKQNLLKTLGIGAIAAASYYGGYTVSSLKETTALSGMPIVESEPIVCPQISAPKCVSTLGKIEAATSTPQDTRGVSAQTNPEPITPPQTESTATAEPSATSMAPSPPPSFATGQSTDQASRQDTSSAESSAEKTGTTP